MEQQTPHKRQNPWPGLLLNIIIPSIILIQLSSEERLGPVYSLVLALAFPLGYGIYDLIRARRIGFMTVLGLVSVLLTGGIGLLQLDVQWLRIKEAAIPFIIGVAVLVSLRTPYPLVRTLLGNVLDMPRVHAALAARGTTAVFEQRLTRATLMVAGSFFLSAILNYTLASLIVVSPPGTSAFNEELGRLTALSFPAIALPSLLVAFAALWYVLHSIKQLAGLDVVEVLPGEE
ncbi:MAG: MFS transporter [Chloroflexaceae bacterium]|nr:MFS transporter [Chloroflexaceae bacterium]NJO04573.1 MFS transporter [Chloroflexaceae bacterium]